VVSSRCGYNVSIPVPPPHTQIEPIFVLTLSWQVTANMRGSSTEEVAARVLSQPSLSGLQVRFETETMFFFFIVVPISSFQTKQPQRVLLAYPKFFATMFFTAFILKLFFGRWGRGWSCTTPSNPRGAQLKGMQ